MSTQGEAIESVALIVDGTEVSRKSDPPYSFLWTPGIVKDYNVNALVTDFYGNTASTPSSVVSIENYYGSGNSLKYTWR